MPDAAPLVVFSDDWGHHPSSCQHLVAKLLPHRSVTWINTIGTRPPRLDWSTFTRGMEKLRSWVWAKREDPTPWPPPPRGEGDKSGSDLLPLSQAPLSPPPPAGEGAGGWGSAPHVLNPKMWPSFRSRFARGLNRRLLLRALRPAVDALPAPPVVVTTLPLVAELVGRFHATRWVYYCVDDFSAWPGLDGRTMRDMEAELVPKVDGVIAVSETLQAHVARLGKPSHLLTHGVDLDFWRAPVPAELPPALRGVDAMPRPLAVYWGVIDRRLDPEFVKALHYIPSAATILFVGPRDNPDPDLLRLPRVQTLPPVPLAELPALAARADILIAPYADLPVTRAMQPLKLKEYMATGKPVVARRLPATAEWGDCIDVVDTPEEFARAVLLRLKEGVPEAQRQARRRLEGESWAAKAEQFEKWVDGLD